MTAYNLEAQFFAAFPQYRDRKPGQPLSRAEASAIQTWAERQPEIVAAWLDRADPLHDTIVQLSGDIGYWAHDHPVQPDGTPAPIPEAQAQAEAADPLLAELDKLTPDQARERLAALDRSDEFRKMLLDGSHAEHAQALAGWHRLHSIADQAAPAADADTPSGATSEPASGPAPSTPQGEPT